MRSGSAVLGGAINIQSTLRLRVESIGEKTRLGSILAELENAHERRTALESRVHKISNVFVIVVLLAAVVTFAIWSYLDSARALDITISLLIVTCPCALGLAIPAALTVALSQAQKLGIFVKNPEALNLLADAEHFYFDKTGTLSRGRLEVRRHLGSERTLAIAAALAARGPDHPVAGAIARMCTAPCAEQPADILSVPGSGMQGRLKDGAKVHLGSRKWCRERNVTINPAMTESIARWESEGTSVCVLDENAQAVAAFALSDPLRPEARRLAAKLQQGRRKLFILSGDSQSVVNCVADQLSIPRRQAFGELSPEEKAAIVAADPAITVMIGDGLNDARAITRGKVGVGVSGGIEASLECADIFLSRDGGATVGGLYAGARNTQRVVMRNIAYSIVYNVIGAALADSGHVTPVFAAILMPLSSLTVVCSSLVSTYFAPPEEKSWE